MASAVYVLCALTSIACAAFLCRSYRRNRAGLQFSSSVCFVGLALNDVLLFVDLVLVPSVDLSLVRSGVAVVAIGVLLYGLSGNRGSYEMHQFLWGALAMGCWAVLLPVLEGHERSALPLLGKRVLGARSQLDGARDRSARRRNAPLRVLAAPRRVRADHRRNRRQEPASTRRSRVASSEMGFSDRSPGSLLYLCALIEFVELLVQQASQLLENFARGLSVRPVFSPE